MSPISMDCIPVLVPHLELFGANWHTFAVRFQEAMKAAQLWGHFNGTALRPVPKDAAAPTIEEEEEMKAWDHEDVVARCLLSQRLPDSTLLRLSACPTVRACWEHLVAKYPVEECQPEQEEQRREKREEGPTNKALAATRPKSGRR